jgi:hypothetical protein
MDETISALLYSWGPLVFFALVLIVIVRISMARNAKHFATQTEFFKIQADNSAKNTEAMRNVGVSLERIAAALEKRI